MVSLSESLSDKQFISLSAEKREQPPTRDIYPAIYLDQLSEALHLKLYIMLKAFLRSYT